MTAYDVRARAQAGRMLGPIAARGKGQVVTITTPGAGTFDPATDTTSGGSPTAQTCSGVESYYTAHSIDGTLIKSGDKKFLLSPFNADGAPITKPVPDRDILTLADGSVWAIKRCDPLAPAGMSVLYELQLRAA